MQFRDCIRRMCVYKCVCMYDAQDAHMESRALISLLQADGFELVSVRGSHHKLRKGLRTVIVPHPRKHLPQGTVASIFRQAGWRK